MPLPSYKYKVWTHQDSPRALCSIFGFEFLSYFPYAFNIVFCTSNVQIHKVLRMQFTTARSWYGGIMFMFLIPLYEAPVRIWTSDATLCNVALTARYYSVAKDLWCVVSPTSNWVRKIKPKKRKNERTNFLSDFRLALTLLDQSWS